MAEWQIAVLAGIALCALVCISAIMRAKRKEEKMIAQIYNDSHTMRIFDQHDTIIADVLLDVSLGITLRECADITLKRLRMKRREKWQETKWGSEAKIRFR